MEGSLAVESYKETSRWSGNFLVNRWFQIKNNLQYIDPG